MAAIITDDFRRNAAQVLVNDITGGTNNYFVGIGKSDAYDNDASGYAEDHASFSLPVPSAQMTPTAFLPKPLMAWSMSHAMPSTQTLRFFCA